MCNLFPPIFHKVLHNKTQIVGGKRKKKKKKKKKARGAKENKSVA